MYRRSLPLLLVLALFAAACGGSDSAETADTSLVTDTSVEEVTSSTAATDAENQDTTTTTAAAQTTTTTEAVEETTTSTTAQPTESTTTTEGVDEVAVLCDAYLGYLAPVGAFAPRIQALEDALGDPAPPGVVDAIDTLRSSDADIEDIFAATDTLEGYILPICQDRYRANVDPAVDNATAGNEFFDAINTGNKAKGAELAPANVVAAFEPWEPLDQDTDVGPPTGQVDGNSLSMLLGPTISVFCEIESGLVTSCAFGE